MRLSALLPVYNEERTIGPLVEKLLDVPEIAEVIAVDDCSTDRSGTILQQIAEREGGRVRVIRQESNFGKGAAVVRALREASGTHVIIQDGDLEYAPSDISALAAFAADHPEWAVVGSRFLDPSRARFPKNANYWGNRLLTALCNLAARGRLNLTDMATCYKLVPRELMQSLDLREQGFGIDPEIVLKLASRRTPVKELPISYRGRRIKDGKKLRWRDGIVHLRCLFQNRVR